MIKVLHIGTDLQWRGGEHQIQLLGLGLKPLGVETYVAYPKASLALEKFKANFKCHAMPKSLDAAAAGLIEFADNNEIQIVNAHSSKAHKLALAIKNRTAKPIRVVVHRRVTDFPKWNFFSKAKYLDDQVDAFVAISSFIAKILESNGVSKNKISVIHDCADQNDYKNTDRTKARAKWLDHLRIDLATSNKPITLIGIIAALTREKGHKTLLEAAALMTADQNFKIVVAGRGPLDAALKKQVAKLRLEDKICFLGQIDNVPSLLSALDIVVLPSTSEGFGSILLDATLAGCSLVASNVGGIPEFVRPNLTGALFEPHDRAALAECLRRQIAEPTFRSQLQKNAFDLAQSEYSLEATSAKTLAVYQRLID